MFDGTVIYFPLNYHLLHKEMKIGLTVNVVEEILLMLDQFIILFCALLDIIRQCNSLCIKLW